jgi:acylphosphatase
VVRNQVIFSGRVQGVGFRHATKMQARSFSVCGFVRNLRDGTVELVIEGEREELASFIAAIEERMVGLIKDTNTTTGVVSGEFSKFSVLY